MLSAAIAKHALIVRLDEAGQQLMQVPMISIAGQAASAKCDRRRYATKPRPAKPSSIIAQVEGSGTEVVRVVGSSGRRSSVEVRPDVTRNPVEYIIFKLQHLD